MLKKNHNIDFGIVLKMVCLFVILQINFAIALGKWTLCSSGTKSTLNAIATNGNKFITVGDSGAILVSDDGIRWTYQSLGKRSFMGIAWGANKFLAMTSRDTLQYIYAGVSSFHRVFSSQDGVTWNDNTADSLYPWHALRWAGNLFIALQSGFDSISLSSNGTVWTESSLRSTGGACYGCGACDVCWGNNTYVATGGYSQDYIYGILGGAMIRTSADGLIWTDRTPNNSPMLNAVTYGDGKFITVGGSGAVFSSFDGNSWLRQTSGTEVNFRAITWGDNQYAAVGDSGNIFSSPNGMQWTRRASGTKVNLNAAVFSNHLFVAVGDSGTILVSEDKDEVERRGKTTGEHEGISVSGRTITFNLSSCKLVSVKAYDIKGRLAWAFSRPNDTHSVAIPAGLASGRYLLTIHAGIHKSCRTIFIGK